MNEGIVYKKNPARCEFDINLHFTAYKKGKTLIDISAPNFIMDNEGLRTDIISAVLTAMGKHGIGGGPRNLRQMPDKEEEGFPYILKNDDEIL